MELIQTTESNVLEYKRELPAKDRKWLKTVVAFANGKGGQIVFGIDDATHSIVGVPEGDMSRTIDRLTDSVLQNCTPQIVPDVRVEAIGGKYVVVVEIEAGQNTPYYLSREGIEAGTYVRAAATTRRAEPHMRLELILRSKGVSYDQYVNSHEPPATEQEVAQLCHVIGSFNPQHAPVSAEQLVGWGVLQEHEGKLLPSVAFCLLARPLSIHFARIQCGVFLGSDRVKFLDNKEFAGPLYEVVRQAEEYVLRNTHTEYIIHDIVREEVHEIPLPALREIIVNAVLHRNYLTPAFIQIAIHPERVEFFSPGGLYGSMTRERMLRGNCSSLRNPLLADMFHKMHLVERWGSGIGRIFEAFRSRGLPAPEYSIDELGVTVTVHRLRPELAASVPDTPQPTTVSRGAELVPVPQAPKPAQANSAEPLLAYIRSNPGCSYAQMQEALALPRRTLSYRLDKLRQKGLIVRNGATRSAVWYAAGAGD